MNEYLVGKRICVLINSDIWFVSQISMCKYPKHISNQTLYCNDPIISYPFLQSNFSSKELFLNFFMQRSFHSHSCTHSDVNRSFQSSYSIRSIIFTPFNQIQNKIKSWKQSHRVGNTESNAVSNQIPAFKFFPNIYQTPLNIRIYGLFFCHFSICWDDLFKLEIKAVGRGGEQESVSHGNHHYWPMVPLLSEHTGIQCILYTLKYTLHYIYLKCTVCRIQQYTAFHCQL